MGNGSKSTVSANGTQVVFGTGPIGCATAKALLGEGLTVRMVSRSGRQPAEALVGKGRLETLAVDAMDPAAVLAACEGATHIYHCMNVPYQDWQRVLFPLQSSLIAAARAQGAVLVVMENLYSYARGVEVINEKTPEQPPTRKGLLRKKLHDALADEGSRNGLRWVSVRASDYYGPGAGLQSVFGTDRFLDPVYAGKRPGMIGNLDVPHTYTYSEDVGRALALAARTPAAHGTAWIVPNDRTLTTREVATMFVSAAGKGVSLGKLPRVAISALGIFNPLIRELVEMLYQKEEPYVVDGSAFSERFGFRPTTLEKGIESTIAWYAHRR
jgi:nucleoside-diphosphate-sugar epimerase